MTIFVTITHVLTCIVLACIILMQSGRGGGLTEIFASAESMFGAKTNDFLIKITTIAASIFLVTNVSLAVLHSREGKSLMSDKVVAQMEGEIPKPLESEPSKPLDEGSSDKDVTPKESEPELPVAESTEK